MLTFYFPGLGLCSWMLAPALLLQKFQQDTMTGFSGSAIRRCGASCGDFPRIVALALTRTTDFLHGCGLTQRRRKTLLQGTLAYPDDLPSHPSTARVIAHCTAISVAGSCVPWNQVKVPPWLALLAAASASAVCTWSASRGTRLVWMHSCSFHRPPQPSCMRCTLA